MHSLTFIVGGTKYAYVAFLKKYFALLTDSFVAIMFASNNAYEGL